MKRLGRWLLVALALGGVGSCSSDAGTGPVAGVLTVSLTTPNAGSDGAIQFRFTGPLAPTSITAAAGARGLSPPPALPAPVAGTRAPTNRAGGAQKAGRQPVELRVGGEMGEGIGRAFVGEVERRRLVGARLQVPARRRRHSRGPPQRELLHVCAGRVAARDERPARCGDAAKRLRGGGGGRDAGRGGRRAHHRGPAGREP